MNYINVMERHNNPYLGALHCLAFTPTFQITRKQAFDYLRSTGMKEPEIWTKVDEYKREYNEERSKETTKE